MKLTKDQISGLAGEISESYPRPPVEIEKAIAIINDSDWHKKYAKHKTLREVTHEVIEYAETHATDLLVAYVVVSDRYKRELRLTQQSA